MVEGTVYGLIVTLRKVFDAARGVANKTEKAANWSNNALPSLTKTAQTLIVDPRVIVSPSLISHEKLKDVLDVLSANFSMYYLQVFNTIGNVTDVRTKQVLNDLSSIKSPNYSKFGGISLEDINDNTVSFTTEDSNQLNISTDNISDISKRLNLASGHLLNLKVASPNGDTTANIPVIIKLNVSAVPFKIIRAILGVNKLESGILSRLDKLFAGEISFVKDFLFAQDLIKEHKKILMTDKTGMYADVSSRISEGLKRYYKKDIKGYGAFYNMAVISGTEQRELEAALGGKLSNTRLRNKLFARNYVMTIAVMDDDRQTLTMYIRDIDGFNSIGYNMLSKSGTDSGDLLALFKKMASGNSF